MEDPATPLPHQSSPPDRGNEKAREDTSLRPREFIEIRSDEQLPDEYVAITTTHPISMPKDQGVYPIQHRDWNKIKRGVEGIVPHGRVFEILASLMSGIAVQALFSLFAFYSVELLPKWVLPVTWVIFIVSLVLAPSFYFLDRLQKKIVSTSVSNLLQEMCSVEAGFHNFQEERPYGNTEELQG